MTKDAKKTFKKNELGEVGVVLKKAEDCAKKFLKV